MQNKIYRFEIYTVKVIEEPDLIWNTQVPLIMNDSKVANVRIYTDVQNLCEWIIEDY